MSQTASGALQRIAERERGERARRASAAALVLRAVEQANAGAGGVAFLRHRAAWEVERLARSTERAILTRLLQVVERTAGCARSASANLLVEYAHALETSQRFQEADAALTLARSAAPADAAIALHAARVARKLCEPQRALELYVRARALDAGGGAIARLASVGEALVSADPERALARAIRGAVRAGDAEAAAVAHEERARVRRSAGRTSAAARDLCVAATRYMEPADRARVAHQLADLAVAAGVPEAAREALLLAAGCGSAPQRDHARSRLHLLARDLGDEVGMRRWRSSGKPALVSLSLSRFAPRSAWVSPSTLVRWRAWLEAQVLPAG